jgi:hypothetical protein
VVEQAARVPSSSGRARELLRNSLGRSRIRIQSQKMQLGLRFAAAKLPGLRAGREGGNLVEPSGGLGGQGTDRGLGGLLSPTGRSVVE